MIRVSIPQGTIAGEYGIVPILAPGTGVPKDAEGCDLSQYNDVKDFLSIKLAGKSVCIHRASKGATGQDTQYKNRWPEIVSTNFDFYGVYHLFIPGVDGTQQFENVMRVTQGDWGNYPITVDVEPIPAGQTYKNPHDEIAVPLKTLLGLLRQKSKLAPIVYTGFGAANVMGLPDEKWLTDYPIHMAQYNTVPDLVPEPWRSAGIPYFAWQYSSRGVVKGITGNVDFDRFTGQTFKPS